MQVRSFRPCSETLVLLLVGGAPRTVAVWGEVADGGCRRVRKEEEEEEEEEEGDRLADYSSYSTNL
jgi:hypothetical protein